MKKLKCLITLILILFLSLSNPKHSVAASFQGLGDLPGKGFNSEAYDISEDGIFVVGRSLGRNGSEAFIWNKEQGIKGFSEGDNINEAMENIQEAIELYLEPVETDITANQDLIVRELVI